MSVMDYDLGRRYSPHHHLSYPDYYYPDRDTPLALSLGVRSDPRAYNIGGPVGGSRGRVHLNTDHDEPLFESGPSRRRIAVACARCRKRKIKCSGDPGNGTGCTACKLAGVDMSSCQFHRVGSDSNVSKVMETHFMSQSLTNMASSGGMTPIYSGAVIDPSYNRPIANQAFTQLDTKPTFPSTWNVPYSEETSPVETYGLEQSSNYLSSAMPMMSSNVYGSTCRWTNPPSRASHQATNIFYDHANPYMTNGIPYTATTTATEPVSPLNMSSLRMTLPERPHPRLYRVKEGISPRRRLPMPQPNPAQTSRNALDNLQDQRLRSVKAGSTSSSGADTSFIKPPPSWNGIDTSQSNGSNTAPSNIPTQTPVSTGSALQFLATAAVDNSSNESGNQSQLELNFSNPTLLDAMTVSAPHSQYSNFRETRNQFKSTPPSARHDSQTGSYSFSSDATSKRSSESGQSTDGCSIVNGRRYIPLSHLQTQASPTLANRQKESFMNRNMTPQRASMSDVSTSF
ncbi:hypothetical protein BDU57DRAFT_588657 [Ampelomyces quisqualis]|uniref:Zn(2)-C6 fungal-type domain-containing protein n=1 Tax=Ampelomyces quisqualis TaxID=50730 RepID=A0A6A5QFX7_AMPQU|nr:hypothetical protein BDU57DRAFT_588657 [Ampelomyces quisqualis]